MRALGLRAIHLIGPRHRSGYRLANAFIGAVAVSQDGGVRFVAKRGDSKEDIPTSWDHA